MLRRSKGSIEEARRDRQLHLPEMYDSERLSAPTDGLFAANQQVHPRDAAGLWKEKDLWAWAKDYLGPRLEALHTWYGSGPENVELRVLTIRELKGTASGCSTFGQGSLPPPPSPKGTLKFADVSLGNFGRVAYESSYTI